MDADGAAREDGVVTRPSPLAEFLRAKRAAVRPAAVGLPTYPGRRVPGLRREEVAQLAGMSVDYYTRLEQGRLATASEGVIVSLAEALRLTPAEATYLRDLLHPQPRRAAGPPQRQVRSQLAALMRSLTDQPAFVLGRGAEILAANPLFEALTTRFSKRAPDDRNLLRWMVLDEGARTLYVDWAQTTSEVAGVLRGELAHHPRDPHLNALATELAHASEDFRRWWAGHDVVERTWGGKRFNHPVVGRLDITYEALTPPGDPDQQLFIYSPVTDADREALRILASWAAEPRVADAEHRRFQPR